MSRSVSRTRVVLAVGAVAGAFALAGCGAGQITQTSSQQSGVDGASANIGQIAVRGAEFTFAGDGKSAVIYPSGGSAPLSMTVANFGAETDKLMAVSSPVAGSVKITGDGTVSAGKLLVVEGAPTPAPTSAPTAGAAPGATASGAATRPTVGAASAEATPVAATPALITPSASPASPTTGGASATGADAAAGASGAAAPTEAAAPTPSPEGTTTAQVVFAGLKGDLKTGLTYPVMLTFQHAGDVTVQVPVGNPKEGSSTG